MEEEELRGKYRSCFHPVGPVVEERNKGDLREWFRKDEEDLSMIQM